MPKTKASRLNEPKRCNTTPPIKNATGTQQELDRLTRSDLKFSDIFETAEPTGSPPACPEGFGAANTASLLRDVRGGGNGEQGGCD